MKLKFTKVGEQIDIKVLYSEGEVPFEYVHFINRLFDGESLEEIEFEGDISDEVKVKLQEMTTKINESINPEQEEQE